MTRPDQKDRDFMDQRRRIARPGFWACLAGVFLFAGLAVWTWFKSRWLIDPFFVAEQIESGSADATTLQMLAIMAPLLFDALIGLGIVLMLIAAFALRNESRYLDIIDRQNDQDQ